MRNLLITLLLISTILFAHEREQKVNARKEFRYRNAQMDKINIAIDNMRYWKEMAKKGYIEVQPEIEIEEAIFTGSKINARGVLIQDSPDIPVNNLTNNTQSENSIFANPTDPDIAVNSNNSTQYPLGSLYGANFFYTEDFGLTWGGQVEGPGTSNSGDPAVAISTTGTYFINYISNSSGQGISISNNQGQSWQTASVAPSPGGFGLLDKNHMWIDNSPTSPYQGNLYAAWTPFGGTNDYQVEMRKSSDGGFTWGNGVKVSSGAGSGYLNQGVNIQTGPEGNVYAAYAIYSFSLNDEDAIGFSRSTDAAATFPYSIKAISNIRGIRVSETSKNQRVNSFPVMAVDISQSAHRGNIYIVWTNIGVPGINNGNDIDVYMIKSSDEGETWSSPIRVNQDPTGLGNEHYFPWITCDPVTGILSVVFYDDRNVGGSQVEVFCANSYDGGETWEDFKVSDVAFTPSPIPGLAGGYMGDYLGISAHSGRVYPVWTDTRGSNVMTYTSPYVVSTTPLAEFDATPKTGTDPLVVQFLDTSFPGLEGIESWEWNFGDGNFSSEQNPAHSFQSIGEYTITLIVSDGVAADTMIKQNFINVVDEVSSSISLVPDWNMFAVPLVADNMSSSNLFPNAITDIYEFDGGYNSVTELEVGKGYWAKFPSSETIDISGTQFYGSIALNEGWNLIGPFEFEVNIQNIVTEPAGIINSAFFRYQGNYLFSTILYPGKAYWVKSSAEGNLLLKDLPLFKGNIELPQIREAEQFVKLQVKESDKKIDLILGNDSNASDNLDDQLGESDLPPMPPAGFDARLKINDEITGLIDIRNSSDKAFDYTLSFRKNSNSNNLSITAIGEYEQIIIKDALNGKIISKVLKDNEIVIPANYNGDLMLSVFYKNNYNSLESTVAAFENNEVIIKWNSINTDAAQFVIERTTDKNSFIKIGEVENNQIQSYSVKDIYAPAGKHYYRINQLMKNGSLVKGDLFEVVVEVPSTYELSQNMPNPFNPSTVIRFSIPVDAYVKIAVYNLLGEIIDSGIEAEYKAGTHNLTFNAGNFASGVYVYSVIAEGIDGSKFTDSKKMILMK